MKTNTILFLLTIIMTTISCSSLVSENPAKWSDKKLTEWFQSGEWKSGWKVMPDGSVNQRELAVQYYKHKDRWEKAFHFLATSDLGNIESGKHELEGDYLFANIQEYVTKNEEDTRFEAHRKYADIQYLISGEEKIGLTALENTTITESYNSEKDVAFMTAGQTSYRLATPECFFVFFPDDAHRPCVKADENITIRKIVIKVLID
jgi:YhcH/YjgK/YiaL family protein